MTHEKSNDDARIEFNVDIVVFCLGENVPDCNKAYFESEIKKIVAHICLNGKVIYTTCFLENPVINEAIQRVASLRGEVCIDGNFSKEEKNMAFGQYAHSGVAMHPSDAGMEEIAKVIFQGLQKANCSFKV